MAAQFGLYLSCLADRIRGNSVVSDVSRINQPAQMETNLFIGGEYVAPAGGAQFRDIEPATERELARVADAGTGGRLSPFPPAA